MLSSGAKDSGGNRFRFFPGASGFLPGRCRGLVGRRYAENGGETTVLRRFESSPVGDRQLSGKAIVKIGTDGSNPSPVHL